MDAAATPAGLTPDPGFVSLAALPPGTAGRVVGVGARAGVLSPLERRLLEFGFVDGEQVEILAEARPGRDPFVVRVGHTTLALRRREAESIWVELQRPGSSASPQAQVDSASERIELHRPGTATSPQTQVASACERVELQRPGSGTARTP